MLTKEIRQELTELLQENFLNACKLADIILAENEDDIPEYRTAFCFTKKSILKDGERYWKECCIRLNNALSEPVHFEYSPDEMAAQMGGGTENCPPRL